MNNENCRRWRSCAGFAVFIAGVFSQFLFSCAAQAAPENGQKAALASLLDVYGSNEAVKSYDAQPVQVTQAMQIAPLVQASSGTLTLTKLDLTLNVKKSMVGGIQGDVIVEIRNTAGTTIGSSRVPAASLTEGLAWNSFTFTPAPVINASQKYRIYLKRTVPQGDSISWKSTQSSGTDVYPYGSSSGDYMSSRLDFAFVVYANGVVNQQQTGNQYGFIVNDSDNLWQEFTPTNASKSITRVDVILEVASSATSGNVIAEIRNTAGSTIGSATLPVASLKRGWGWNTFTFSTAPVVNIGEKYTIYLRRSVASSATDYVYWESTYGDYYSAGSSSASSYYASDFGFKVYTGGVVNQQQLGGWQYGGYVSNFYYSYQEFVVGFVP